MERRYVVGEDHVDIAFQDMIDTIRADNTLKVFERNADGSLVPVTINIVSELTYDDQIANGITSLRNGGTLTFLKSGHIVKEFPSNWIAPRVMADMISRISGFAPVTILGNTLTYEPMSHRFPSEHHRKYVYQLFRGIYELHRRGLCHLNLTPSSIGVIDNNLVISDYESARACYSSLDESGLPIYYQDIRACGRLVSYITRSSDSIGKYSKLISECLDDKIVRITRVLQDELFADILDVELVSVRPIHIYSSLSPIEPSRQACVKLSQLLQTKLEPTVSQSMAIEILLKTGVYDFDLAQQLVTGIPIKSLADHPMSSPVDGSMDIHDFTDLLIESDNDVQVFGSTGHLIESYGGGPFSYRAMLSLYSLPDLNQHYFAELACLWETHISHNDPNPDIESVAPDDDKVYARKLKISQPVTSGLTKAEINSLV